MKNPPNWQVHDDPKPTNEVSMRRSYAGKGSGRKFKARTGKTAKINLAAPLRGGIRL